MPNIVKAEPESIVFTGYQQLAKADADFPVEQNLDGIEPSFPLIKILATGAVFQFPDQTTKNELQAVILETRQIRYLQQQTSRVDEEGEYIKTVVCSSNDNIMPNPLKSPDIKAANCAQCQFAQYGTGKKGRGSACILNREIFILVPGSPIPFRLKLNFKSIKPFESYMMHLTSIGIHRALAFSAISLDLQTKGGFDFSVVKFRLLHRIANEKNKKVIKVTLDNIKQHFEKEREEIEAAREKIATGGTVETQDFEADEDFPPEENAPYSAPPPAENPSPQNWPEPPPGEEPPPIDEPPF